MIFVIEVGSHHIYDDTGFCHNYCHRSVISMTEKFHLAQNVTDVSFFVVVGVHPTCLLMKTSGI